MKFTQLRGHARELGFTPQDQVRWLAPKQLFRIAVQVGMASAFASLADNRELQRPFPSSELSLPPDPDGGCWIDYAADVGDGFDPTYTVAGVLARPSLELTDPDGDRHDLPRASLLVLGGDEVYPIPSPTGYADRLRGPYRAAFPAPPGARPDDGPAIIALPGNHDWYDGLTAFLRVFAQHRRIGGWRTIQERSYFAVRLPHRWWLVGLDTQLGSEIDAPQLDYFRTRLTHELRPGDSVIVCCPSPTWVRTPARPVAFDTLNFFDRTILRTRYDHETGLEHPTGAQARLWITGDHHHYARYVQTRDGRGEPADEPEAVQFVTCGLGGAYLASTHRLPETLDLPSPTSTHTRPGETSSFRLAERWPSLADSRRMARGLFAPPPRGLPYRNPGFWTLAGAVHAVGFLILIGLLALLVRATPLAALRTATPNDTWELGGQLAVWALVITVGWSFAPVLHLRRPRLPRMTAVAVMLQLAIAVAGLVVINWLVRLIELPSWFPGGRALPDYILLGVALAGTVAITGLVASYAVALSLAVTGSHHAQDWQDSAQALEDRKGFVRIRLDGEGRLHLYPVVIDRVCHDWELEVIAPGEARPVPAGDPPAPRLLERPVTIAPTPKPSPAAPPRPAPPGAADDAPSLERRP